MTNRVTSKSFRKCTATAAHRQNSYQQTNKHHRSLITKILLNLYFSPNIVSRTFRQVILPILPLYLVYCHVLVAYIYNVIMPSCATYGCVNSSSKGSDLTFREIAPEDKKHSRKQWLNNISDDPGYYQKVVASTRG